MLTYRLDTNPPRITCLLCGRTSHHPQDIAERYCGACHMFHEHAALLLDLLAQQTREMVRQYKNST